MDVKYGILTLAKIINYKRLKQEEFNANWTQRGREQQHSAEFHIVTVKPKGLDTRVGILILATPR